MQSRVLFVNTAIAVIALFPLGSDASMRERVTIPPGHQSRSAQLQLTNTPEEPTDATTETVLLFETENFAVRVTRYGDRWVMNLYNKQIRAVELRDAPVELVRGSGDWITYRTLDSDIERFARYRSNGQAELEILEPNSGITLARETGYDVLVQVPNGRTRFRGTNFAPGISAIVTAPEATPLYRRPTIESDTIGAAATGASVQVLDRVGNPTDGYIWYQITHSGKTGWVRGDTLQPSSDISSSLVGAV